MSPRKLATPPEERLYDRIAAILDEARSRVARTVNTAMVHAYWLIGREIVEVEQGGKERAGYGDELMGHLATRLSGRFGKGFTVTGLKRMRQFYRAFPDGSAIPADLGGPDKGAAARHLSRSPEKRRAARRDHARARRGGARARRSPHVKDPISADIVVRDWDALLKRLRSARTSPLAGINR